MRQIRRRQPRGSNPAPIQKGKPVELPRLVGKRVELFLQGEPLAQDECYGGRLLYLTPTWLGFVGAYRTHLFYDHIPISTIRKIRDISNVRLSPTDQKKADPFAMVDFDSPSKLTDLINEEVIVYLQGNQLLRDAGFRTRLTYVKKAWIGVSSFFNNKLLLDHIPISAIRKVTKVVLKNKPGRYLPKDR
jgi:hypothetical protein